MATFNRYSFENSSGEFLSPIYYEFFSNQNNQLIESGTTQLYYLAPPQQSGAYLRLASRLGYNTWDSVSAPYTQVTTETSVNNDTIRTFHIVLNGTGEVASNDRLLEAFTTVLDIGSINSINLLPNDKNYSFNKLPPAITNANFKYSNIASVTNPNMVLRLQDYLRVTNIWDVFSATSYQNKYNYTMAGLNESATTESLISYNLSASTATTTMNFKPQAPEIGVTSAYTSHQQPAWYNNSAYANIMSGDGFHLYFENGEIHDDAIKHTIVEHQIISGTLCTFSGVAGSSIGFIGPAIKLETSTSAWGSYHTTTYVSGYTKLELIRSGTTTTSSTTLTELTYPVNVSTMWITDLTNSSGVNYTSCAYTYSNNNIVPLQIISANTGTLPSVYRNYFVKITCDLQRIIVLHTACFNHNWGNNWLKLKTNSRLSVPQQVIQYGYGSKVIP
jgi:hypothetical protein